MRVPVLLGSLATGFALLGACSSSDSSTDASSTAAGGSGGEQAGAAGNVGVAGHAGNSGGSAGKGGSASGGKAGAGGKGGSAGSGGKAGAGGVAGGGGKGGSGGVAGTTSQGGAAGAPAQGGSAGTGTAGSAGAGAAGGGAAGGSGGGAGGASCTSDAWPTYGHDARRTFASPGCISGALTTAFRYVPTPPSGETIGNVFHAISDGGGAYLSWRGHMGPYFGTPFVDKVGPDGKNVWQFSVGDDSSFGSWPTLAVGALVINDDGLVFVDVASGKATHNAGVDFWGQTAPGDGRVYVVNAEKVDGPGVFVAAYDADQKQLWIQNQSAGSGQFNPTDTAGGMAVDGATLFYAANYVGNPPPALQNGVYAFDAAAGTPLWVTPTTPTGPPSAGEGKIFLSEGTPGMWKLVARNQTDGSVAWMATPGGQYTGGQPPVLAGGLAIVHNGTSILAYHTNDGSLAWMATVSWSFPFSGTYEPVRTTLAAATGSGTLISLGTSTSNVPLVTLVDLATGAIASTSEVPMAMGNLVDPIIVGKRVYVSDGQGLLALDAP